MTEHLPEEGVPLKSPYRGYLSFLLAAQHLNSVLVPGGKKQNFFFHRRAEKCHLFQSPFQLRHGHNLGWEWMQQERRPGLCAVVAVVVAPVVSEYCE